MSRKELKSIYSTETSNNKYLNKAHDPKEKDNKSANNPNISRTNLVDTQLIDINADGDSDESKYNDLM